MSEIWGYQDTGTSIKLYGYYGKDENIVVPEMIEDKPVEILFLAMVTKKAKSIFIPKTVKKIIVCGHSTFLENITVDKDNEWFASRNGVLYNKNYSVLIRFPCAKEYQESVLDGVVEISRFAFEEVDNIYAVDFPDTVCKIGSDAFNNCGNLKSVTMTDSITEIGTGVFCGCGLKQIKLSQNIHEFDCSDYDDEYPGFFSFCHFTEFFVPEHIEKIGERTFEYNIYLKKVYIPATVKEIGEYAFVKCDSLEAIVVSEDNEFYYSKDGVLYSYDNKLIHYPKNKNSASFKIPVEITEICPYAFDENSQLKNITIGSNVTCIGERAFYCTSIKELYIPKSVQRIDLHRNSYMGIKIIVDKDSFMEKLCIENHLDYSVINDQKGD